MKKENFSGQYVSIPYTQLIKLIKEDKVELGIDDLLSQKVSQSGDAAKSTRYAKLLWDWVGIGVFFFSIYLSIKLYWYLFFFGFLIWNLIYRANKKATSENILAEAQNNKIFYEKVRKSEGWIYHTDIKTAKKFKIKDGYPFKNDRTPWKKK